MRETTFGDIRERYLNDPKFRAGVEMMTAMLLTQKYTPYELRDMAYYASIKFAHQHVEPMFIRQTFPEDENVMTRVMQMMQPHPNAPTE